MRRVTRVSWILLCVTCVLCVGDGKIVEGEINTNTDWEFITRFCFLSSKGTLKFTFEYPITYGPEFVLLYFDTPDQWDSVYKTDKSCAEKVSVLNPDNNQIIYLTTSYGLSGCEIKNVSGVVKYICNGGRTFRSSRERWWFVAVSRCDRDPTDPIGIYLKYKIHMTNGYPGDYLHREYSADEFYIMPISLSFLIVYIVLCALVIICAILLRNRQLFHTTYKLYMAAIFTWTAYLLLYTIAYGVYGNDGIDYKLTSTKYAARTFESLSTLMFLLMLILMGKGYTITRGRLSTVSTIKITVFFTVYTIAYVVLFIYEGLFFDPGLVLYLYESPAGYGLIAMRLIGWSWFCYAIFFTLKHYKDKGTFFYPFFIFYTIWFWAGPIVIVVSTFAIALWSREKTVVAVENFVALCGHVFFLILTRPSAANTNFPYHVRTTQIGILNTNAPTGSGEDTESFGIHAYSISAEQAVSSQGPDLTGMFTTSKTRKSVSEEPESSYSGEQSKASLPPSYSTVELQKLEESRRHISVNSVPEDDEEDEVNGNAGLFLTPSSPVADQQPPPSYHGLFQAKRLSSSSSSSNMNTTAFNG